MGQRRRTSTSEDDPSHILIDEVQRGDARPPRVSVEEPIQPLPLDPIPHTTRISQVSAGTQHSQHSTYVIMSDSLAMTRCGS